MVKTYSNYIGVLFALTVTLLSACGKSSSSTPTTVPNSATIFYAHNLVFRNGTTMSTGYNGFGQLGTGNLGNRTALGLLSAYYPFAGFATGGNHSVAFINNSTVRTWGYNAFGQLGNNSTTYSSNPVPVFANRSATVNLTGIKAVAAGAYHSLALKNDDTLWAWGQNYYGQLGVDFQSTPPFNISYVAVKTNGAGVIFSNISSIAANGYHSLARANGFAWAWGFNGTGQLGIDPKITGAMSSPIRIPINATSAITSIAAGGAFNYAAEKAGFVWAWGNNDYGQLGNGTLTQSYVPVQVIKADTTPLTGVVQVAAGIQHGLARLANGEVWAWGYNFFGQLGDGSTKDSPVAVKVNIPAGVTDIRAFGSSSMAKVGSDWYVWGDNFYGQLGLATTGKVLTPEKMLGL